ncbi:MAG: hypothetical protein FJ304_13600 [Planctomycetes bacterium]|nr:hypothetical protein [Planctomycetota bacterium]
MRTTLRGGTLWPHGRFAFPEAFIWERSVEQLRQQRGDKEVEAARSILAWAKAKALRLWWGKGTSYGSCYPMLDLKGEEHWVVSVWTHGKVEIPFQWMLNRKPFGDEAMRLALRERLTAIPGVEIRADALARRPTLPLAALAEPARLAQFLAVWDWYLDQVRGA